MIGFNRFTEQKAPFKSKIYTFLEEQLKFIALMKNSTPLFGLFICIVGKDLFLCVLCFIRKLALTTLE